MRLNGWQRIGIVASVVWAIGGPIYVENATDNEALATFVRVHRACLDATPAITLSVYAHRFRQDDGKAAAAINAAVKW
jgi:hypothetical protein